MSNERSVSMELNKWARANRVAALATVVVVAVMSVALYRVFTESGVLPAALLAGGIALAWTADLFPKQLAAAFAESWATVSVISGAVVIALLEQFTDATGSPAFYEASAQIIPVLLLAMALEVRLLPPRLTGGSLRTAMLIVYLLAGAEFAALQSIERGRGGPRQFEFTVAGLVSGSVAVSLIAVSATVNKRGRPIDDHGSEERAQTP